MIRFPKPLSPGDTIAITAPSSGVDQAAHPRLDLVISNLRKHGFKTIEGRCLRTPLKEASASARERACELMAFLTDPAISAVMPPWGGELACDILDLLDFPRLRDLPPKWFLGYSDLSTLHVPLTLLSGWATAHGHNLMDLTPNQCDPLSTSVLKTLSHDFAAPLKQNSSQLYQTRYIDFTIHVEAGFNLTQPTLWRRLDGSVAPVEFQGRLIGGCIDTIGRLAGSRYADIPQFIHHSKDTGAILYLENCDYPPLELSRALWSLRRAGWFTGLSGLLLGRSNGPTPDAPHQLSYTDALVKVLGDLPCPVLYDVDIGHRPPQFTLINGALAQVTFESGAGSITQCAHHSTPPVSSPLTRPGGLSYLEIPAANPRQSAAFYAHGLGWSIMDADTDHPKFMDPSGLLLGRWITSRPPSAQPGLLPFIYIADIHDTIKRITDHGGEIVKPIYPEGNLLVATFRDPAGNILGIWQEAKTS